MYSIAKRGIPVNNFLFGHSILILTGLAFRKQQVQEHEQVQGRNHTDKHPEPGMAPVMERRTAREIWATKSPRSAR